MGFTAEDLQAALAHCGDRPPIAWLQENWRNMMDTVVTLATNYGHERRENTVGTISVDEARDALRAHKGNVWSAVTECVEQRQKKVGGNVRPFRAVDRIDSWRAIQSFFGACAAQYAELLSRGNFTREDIVTSLTANHGNLEAAYVELSRTQLKPFLMRIWGPPSVGTDNEAGNMAVVGAGEGVEAARQAPDSAGSRKGSLPSTQHDGDEGEPAACVRDLERGLGGSATWCAR